MLTASDFIHLPYPPDLTEGGIAYALRAMQRTYMSYYQMRRVAANFAGELAFRRYLSQQNIPFEIQTSLPMNEHERHDVLLGGRRCDIKSFFISYRDQIASLRRDANVILGAPALVPSDIDASEGHLDKDVYIFAFALGLKADSRDLPQILGAKQPHYLIHAMPRNWREPAYWNPLGELTLKSEADTNAQIEISGQDSSRGFISRVVNLIPQKRITLKEDFYSISAIHLRGVPSARVGIRSSIQRAPYIIHPEAWQNIWVYGIDILLTGFITRGEFHQRATHIPPKTRVFQYNWTRVKNLAVPISSLRPLQGLFARAVI